MSARESLRLAVALSMLAALSRFEKVNFTRNHVPRRFRRVAEKNASPSLKRLLTVRRPTTSAPFHIPAWQQGPRRVS